ncbi:fluoride efflux transporter CrcB [Ammonicoccus fulvus]|uniref:Fluoride-specific ion channel FluC n=1 Tax=Ammonicoccus fulvus TaxID=3138240 RepID=A0ABZ3FJL3_9ACTN
MTPLLVVLVSVGGGLGAVVRFLTDARLSRNQPRVPIGTFVINLSGSLLLGFLVGWLGSRDGMSATWLAILGTGFCGGYTTFSTASVEVVRLWVTEGQVGGWAYALATLIGSVLAAAAGLSLGGLLG